MFAKVLSAELAGLDAHLVEVEVDIGGGLPQFSVVGLSDATVHESRDRVRSAFLPSLTSEEVIETARVYSAAGLLGDGRRWIMSRAFRTPHHSISDAGLIEGGAVPRPGEVSPAHYGARA